MVQWITDYLPRFECLFLCVCVCVCVCVDSIAPAVRGFKFEKNYTDLNYLKDFCPNSKLVLLC